MQTRSGGKVGIGTTNPMGLLDINELNSGSMTYALKLTNPSGTANTAVGLYFILVPLTLITVLPPSPFVTKTTAAAPTSLPKFTS